MKVLLMLLSLLCLFEVTCSSRGVSNQVSFFSSISSKLAKDRRSKRNNEFELQLFCGDLMPTLLQTPQDDNRPKNDTSFRDYISYYKRRKMNMEETDLGSFNFWELTGHPSFQIMKSGGVLYSNGWNQSHVMPYISNALRTSQLVWTQPPSEHLHRQCDVKFNVPSKLYLVANWFPGNFGHFLHDTLPTVLWLYNFVLGHGDRVALADSPLHRSLLQWLHPRIYRRVKWVKIGQQVNCLSEGTLVAVYSPTVKDQQVNGRSSSVWDLRNPSLFRNFALTVAQEHPTSLPSLSSSTSTKDGPRDKRSIVFYSRRSSSTLHGRMFSKQFEDLIIHTFKSILKLNNRREEFVVFNGQGTDGIKLGYEEQFDIFRRANLVVGPHGSGLANLLWLSPSLALPGDCSQSPVVLEIITDTLTSKAGVQGGGSTKSYFNLMGGLPWMRYYHIFLAKNSTNEQLYVNLDVFTRAVNEVMKIMPSSE